jgi:hypothetical protein
MTPAICPGSGEPALEQRTQPLRATVDDARCGSRQAYARYGSGICPTCGALKTVDTRGVMRRHHVDPRGRGPVGKLRAVEHVNEDGRFLFRQNLGTGRWIVTAADPRDARFVPRGSHPTLRLAFLALEQRIREAIRKHRAAS